MKIVKNWKEICVYIFSFEVLFSSESCLKIYQVQVKLVIDSDSRLNKRINYRQEVISVRMKINEKKRRINFFFFPHLKINFRRKSNSKNLIDYIFLPTSDVSFYIFPILRINNQSQVIVVFEKIVKFKENKISDKRIFNICHVVNNEMFHEKF